MAYDLLSPPVLTALGICVAAAAATMLGGFSIIKARESNPRMLAFGLAFAGGAMVYISLVEIFWKSYQSFGEILPEKEAYTSATLAFFGGVVLLMLIDRLVPNPHNKLTAPHDESKSHLKRVGLLAALAITVHNFPEGMATFFATLEDPVVGASLAFAIAIHNIPEGVSIAIPVYYATGDKKTDSVGMFTFLCGRAYWGIGRVFGTGSFPYPFRVWKRFWGDCRGDGVFVSG